MDKNLLALAGVLVVAYNVALTDMFLPPREVVRTPIVVEGGQFENIERVDSKSLILGLTGTVIETNGVFFGKQSGRNVQYEEGKYLIENPDGTYRMWERQ